MPLLLACANVMHLTAASATDCSSSCNASDEVHGADSVRAIAAHSISCRPLLVTGIGGHLLRFAVCKSAGGQFIVTCTVTCKQVTGLR
jgi:hypothetical protein